MSVYGYVVCTDCKEMLFLGRAVFDLRVEDQSVVKEYWRASRDGLPNYSQMKLNRLLWKFLAKNTGHNVRIVLEHELEKLVRDDEYADIGEDSLFDYSLFDYTEEEYLSDESLPGELRRFKGDFDVLEKHIREWPEDLSRLLNTYSFSQEEIIRLKQQSQGSNCAGSDGE
jgi:hypothetical protein